jgi:hypothetical protein
MGGGAAFGIYPQMKPRRQGSPADSANLPIDVLRGRLAGLLGLPADIANLIRSPQPQEMFGDVNYEAPAQFPYTTDRFLKDLPMAPTSRVGLMAGQAASFVPLNPMPAVRGVQRVGQMVGEELGATMMGQRPNSLMSKIVPQPLFAVPPEQGLFQAKPQAPVSDIGFYSAAEQAALNLARNKGTGQSFLNDLMKAPDVKKEELAYTGLDDFLANKPNVTKQEIQDFIGQNKVAVNEVRLGEQFTEDPVGVSKRLAIFDRYEPEIQALYKEMDDPRYRLVNRGMGAEEYNRGVVLQNRGFRGEPLTVQEQSELDDILRRLDGNTVQEFANAEEARKVYLGMSQEEKLMHSIRPVRSSTELQQEINTLQRTRDIEADKAYVIPEPAPTKYQKYQLPGGENYREILLTTPTKNVTEQTWQVLKPDGTTTTGYFTSEDAARRNADYIGGTIRQSDPVSYEAGYRSSHFSEPNILAHMRVNDRIDADGKKMLLVEEIQSDWHQAGREKGYRKQSGSQALELESKAITEERKNLVAELSAQEKQNGFVSLENQKRWDKFKEKEYSFNQKNRDFYEQAPDAPFKDTWYQLALKRLTKYAAENGYERIGLTTGKQQAGRYKLSNEVDEINVIGRTNMATGEKSKSVALDMKSGQSLRIGVNNDGIVDNVSDESIKNFMGKNLSEVVGKDIAKEIMLNNKKTISGEGLDIGGEGMKKYYDEIYPKFLDKYGKKYGASVGQTKIKTDNVPYVDYVVKQGYFNDHTVFGVEPNGTTTVINQNAANMAEAQALANRYKEKNLGGGETIRYLDVTPQMKQGTSKGQPLFAAVPALPIATMDYTDPFPDTAR